MKKVFILIASISLMILVSGCSDGVEVGVEPKGSIKKVSVESDYRIDVFEFTDEDGCVYYYVNAQGSGMTQKVNQPKACLEANKINVEGDVTNE